MMDEETFVASWIPDVIGPIFQKDRFTMKEALNLQSVDEQIHLMATFLPDEVIRGIVLSEKSTRSFRAVLLLLNTSGFSTLSTKCIYDENMGSLAFTNMLNNYIGAVEREIYRSEGDVLKLSDKNLRSAAGGLLAVWKMRDDQFTFDTVQKVIECAIRIRDLNHDGHIPKANIAISAGEVTFSVVGNDEARDFVLHGAAISELKLAGKVSQPNDLVLSFSAWRHCTPSQYEYVVKDSRNVKIIKVLMRSQEKSNANSVNRKSVTDPTNVPLSHKGRTTFIHQDFHPTLINDTKEETFTTLITAITKTNPNFMKLLKSYLMKSVIQQVPFASAMKREMIEHYQSKRLVRFSPRRFRSQCSLTCLQIVKDQPLDFLTAIRHVTTVSLEIVPDKYTNDELFLLVDKCFLLVHRVVTQYAGYIDAIDLCEKNLIFCIVFGERGDQRRGAEVDEVCRNGITCAMQVLRTVKSIARIYNMFVGVSTGLAYCGVLGNATRKHYVIIGPTIDRAVGIMNISYDKISCDYNTVLHSHLSKDRFRPRGLRTVGPSERCQVYQYLDEAPQEDDSDGTLSAEYGYPILGRQQELDEFDDVLDEIGVAGRTYSGLLIEGGERSGKSRVLDALVASVRDRQIRSIELSLHVTYAEKTHAVIYHLILQILEAEDCNTIEERQKALLAKLAGVIASEDLCYLNDLMRVCFPLSDAYCSNSNWHRRKKMVDIFETILKQLKTKICILLDNVQYMDDASWQFLSSALDHNHVVVAMTMLTTEQLDDSQHYSSRTKALIRGDTRLMKRTLYGLDPHLLPALACQFLNVLAIPRKLSRTLLACTEGNIGWCEIYLTSLLQSDALEFIRILPGEASQRDLVFPDGRMITKLPVDLTPQEQPPPLAWSRLNYLDVCDVNGRYLGEISDVDRNTKKLMRKSYERMTPFERRFIACAATLGTVFKRKVLLDAMSSDNSEYDAANTAISEMFRMRILECASLQRRDFHSDELVLCILKKRRTFSDMRHSVTCNCHLSRRQTIVDTHLPLGTHCKTLEFKVDLFRKIVYDAQSDIEKRQHHARAVKIYGQNARKCNSCGAGTFFRIPGEDMSTRKKNIYPAKASLVHRKTIFAENSGNKRKSFTAERSGFDAASSLSLARRREFVSNTRRVSIMPTYLDHDEGRDISTRGNEETGESLMRGPSKFWRRISASVAPETRNHNWSGYLDAFSHIDYRSCQCDGVISCLFWRLHQHIENSGEVNKIIGFLLEYSAGLIQIAQPSHAIKLLAIVAERNEKTARVNNNAEENVMIRGIILALTGDAHSALGNYALAKKYYSTAVTLRGAPLKMHKVMCYGPLMTVKIHRKLRDLPRHVTSEKSAREVARSLEMAFYMRRLCLALVREDKLKAANMFVLQSFKMGFPSFDGFLEKGEIYLASIRVFCRVGDIELTRCIEKPMLTVTEARLGWNDAEEVAMLAKVYFAMYQVRALKGELEDAVEMGVKVLRISGTLHLNDLTLAIMPSFIEILLWTKRINQAVDLMAELYFIAEEDMDLSAKTWYHALCLELLLDAGVLLESYETSLNYYEKFIAHRSKSYVLRDPQSCCRLLTCLWIYQLRMGYTLINATTYNADAYVENVDRDCDFTRIFTCCKGLEYYLLVLLRCINMKHSDELQDRVRDVRKIVRCLDKVSGYATVVKPRFYLLTAYLNVIHGRKSAERFYLRKARKLASAQGNQLIEASSIQNERTWAQKIYNNMARYWLENAGSSDFVHWQYACSFSVKVWSTILCPLPIPDTYL